MANKLSVLIIDDDEDVRNTLYDNLTESGLQVTLAEDGEKGLFYIHSKKPPNVVITDIVMPGEEGLGVIRAIRSKKLNIKIIAISGSDIGSCSGANFLKMAEKLGADAIFPKPVNIDHLESLISSFSNSN